MDILLDHSLHGFMGLGTDQLIRAVKDIDVYIEQPCPSYEQCLSIRRNTTLPFVLDEVIDSVDAILKGAADGAMDVVNIKISKFTDVCTSNKCLVATSSDYNYFGVSILIGLVESFM